MITAENEYPWGSRPRVLSLTTESEFHAFISSLEAATKQLPTTCHFDSITSLINLHKRFLSNPSRNLEETWKSFTVEECAVMKEMSCVGLALKLKEIIVKMNPEWEDYIALGITNEWTRAEAVPETFWTSKKPPSFPEQCREHSLLFIRVSLEHKRKAVVFLDPGRNIATPLVVTEYALPPQSSTLVLNRKNKTREHTVSWGGPEYVRWIIGERKDSEYSETYLRVYVGRCFEAGSYLDWHNLVFPYRALMFMTPCNGVTCFRVGKALDHIVIMIADEETGNVTQLSLLFEPDGRKWNESQTLAIKIVADKFGQEELLRMMNCLEIVMSDRDFAAQLLTIWDKVNQETGDTFRELVE